MRHIAQRASRLLSGPSQTGPTGTDEVRPSSVAPRSVRGNAPSAGCTPLRNPEQFAQFRWRRETCDDEVYFVFAGGLFDGSGKCDDLVMTQRCQGRLASNQMPEHYHSGLCQLVWNGIVDSPMIGLVSNHHTRVGPVTAANMHQQRENHSEEDTLLNTEYDDSACGDQGKNEFAPTYARISARPR